MTKMIDDVREEYLKIVLAGTTEEEMDANLRFIRQMFENSRRAIERGEGSWNR